MHPKIKSRQPGASAPLRSVRPPLAHDKANPAFDRGVTRPTPRTAGAANHARHHVARQAQA